MKHKPMGEDYVEWLEDEQNRKIIHILGVSYSVLYPPWVIPCGIHGMGGGLQKFQVDSMEWWILLVDGFHGMVDGFHTFPDGFHMD